MQLRFFRVRNVHYRFLSWTILNFQCFIFVFVHKIPSCTLYGAPPLAALPLLYFTVYTACFPVPISRSPPSGPVFSLARGHAVLPLPYAARFFPSSFSGIRNAAALPANDASFSEAAGSVFILRDLLHAEDTFVFFPSAFTVL